MGKDGSPQCTTVPLLRCQVTSVLSPRRARGQQRDHVQCMPERLVPRTFEQVTALAPEVCKTVGSVFPNLIVGNVADAFLLLPAVRPTPRLTQTVSPI